MNEDDRYIAISKLRLHHALGQSQSISLTRVYVPCFTPIDEYRCSHTTIPLPFHQTSTLSVSRRSVRVLLPIHEVLHITVPTTSIASLIIALFSPNSHRFPSESFIIVSPMLSFEYSVLFFLSVFILVNILARPTYQARSSTRFSNVEIFDSVNSGVDAADKVGRKVFTSGSSVLTLSTGNHRRYQLSTGYCSIGRRFARCPLRMYGCTPPWIIH